MIHRALAIIMLFMAAAHATADDAGNHATNTFEAGTEALKKCGEAKLTVLFWDVYESALYTPDGAYQPGVRPLKLDIRYLRNIKASDLVKQTRKEWQAQGLAHPQQEAWLAQLEALWPDVAANDVITLMIDQSGNAQFNFNGEPLGAIPEPAFADQFAAIWLSPNTTRPELRAQLIGS